VAGHRGPIAHLPHHTVQGGYRGHGHRSRCGAACHRPCGGLARVLHPHPGGHPNDPDLAGLVFRDDPDPHGLELHLRDCDLRQLRGARWQRWRGTSRCGCGSCRVDHQCCDWRRSRTRSRRGGRGPVQAGDTVGQAVDVLDGRRSSRGARPAGTISRGLRNLRRYRCRSRTGRYSRRRRHNLAIATSNAATAKIHFRRSCGVGCRRDGDEPKNQRTGRDGRTPFQHGSFLCSAFVTRHAAGSGQLALCTVRCASRWSRHGTVMAVSLPSGAPACIVAPWGRRLP